ncbi:MAG: nitronate monooxygenase, partial [Deltaproteobacteria bacterium]|nr:nitronate monooxygenase [Deltaproteobacteria bacterium]
VKKIRAIELEKGSDIGIEDIRHLVAGAENRKVLQEGDMDAGAWSAGMVAGLIHDIPTCAELIERIVGDAEEMIRDRLAKIAAA